MGKVFTGYVLVGIVIAIMRLYHMYDVTKYLEWYKESVANNFMEVLETIMFTLLGWPIFIVYVIIKNYSKIKI